MCLRERLNAIEHNATDHGNTDRESLVEFEWLESMRRHWRNLKLSRVYQCDAYVENDGYAILIEFKYDIDQSSAHERAKVLAQVVAYYDKILSGRARVTTPSVVFVADVNEAFCVHVNYLNPFVGMLDRSLSPSAQWQNGKLVAAIESSQEINDNSVVYHVNDADFDPAKIFNYMKELAKGIVRIVPITADTLKKGFDFFCQKILLSTEGMSANDLVGRYYAFIKSQDNAIIMNGRLMGVDGYAPVAVNESLARQFKTRFGVLDENDHRELERMYDQLVGEAERRWNGQFFTPSVWVDEAHRRIARVAGDTWEQDCLTWDCCCGTKSLTRDYEFGNLYLSTLDRNELSCSERLSPEARQTFVLDFLNGASATYPRELRNELNNRRDEKIIFILNPPYGQATGGRTNAHRAGIADTAVKARMTESGMGRAANELTVQFLYRILEIVKEYRLTDVTVGLFSNPAWLTGDACEAFRETWLDTFTFDNAFAFRSEEFAGVKPGWAINFSVWRMR
jgi:hypothetical protein